MGHIAFGTLAWVSGIPTASMLLGMVLVQWKEPSKKLEALFQHFGAGVVLGAVAVELLPILLDSDHHHSLDFVGIALGFSAGVAAMLLIARANSKLLHELRILLCCLRRHSRVAAVAPETVSHVSIDDPEQAETATTPSTSSQRIPWGMIMPVATDASMDGLLVGISFVAGELTAGLIMALALAIEMAFLGVTTSASVKKRRVARAVAVPLCVAIPLLIMAMSFVGASVLAHLSGPLFAALLSFGLAALLFLVTDELLVEAHKGTAAQQPPTAIHDEADTWWITAFFFLGFALVILLEEVSQHGGTTREPGGSGGSSSGGSSL
eukprot:m51a1_g10217 hypothetical protein (323) ;mRNA; r:111874-113259